LTDLFGKFKGELILIINRWLDYELFNDSNFYILTSESDYINMTNEKTSN